MTKNHLIDEYRNWHVKTEIGESWGIEVCTVYTDLIFDFPFEHACINYTVQFSGSCMGLRLRPSTATLKGNVSHRFGSQSHCVPLNSGPVPSQSH